MFNILLDKTWRAELSGYGQFTLEFIDLVFGGADTILAQVIRWVGYTMKCVSTSTWENESSTN